MLGFLILEIGIACLTVFGFCCLLQLLFDCFYAAKHFYITVEIREERDADMLDMLLHEARSAFFRKRRMKTLVLISSHLFEKEIVGTRDGVLYDPYADLLEEYAAECYIMDWD